MTAAVPILDAHGVHVTYGGRTVIRDVDISVDPGETVAVLGPSGAGKTTLLYAIAGFLPLSSGEIRLGGRLVAAADVSVPPEERRVGMVFQNYGLWPHMDAAETVAYPMRRSGTPKADAQRRALELLGQMRIEHLERRKPAELSGGEQQRVGLARALARQPDLYLFDEPTAHLDAALRAELRTELAGRLRGDAAAIHATHDVEEALAVADRVVLLRDGAVVQVDTPTAVYARPVDEWAARLTGPASIIEGPLAQDAAGADGPGRYLVRPDWLRFGGPLPATILDVRYHGTHTDYLLGTSLGDISLREAGAPQHAPDESVDCRLERVWRMPGPP